MDLLEAEAQIRANGDVGSARTIVNNGSRVNVGELPELESSASEDEVLEAIQYERDIQLYRTGIGLQYFDMRRHGKLQTGTPLHMPVPAPELQTVQVDLYTFGGSSKAGEPGTASGENAWCTEFPAGCEGPFGPYENATFDFSNSTKDVLDEGTSPNPPKAQSY